jgi:TetR/AcrR family transcriptional regulator, cholesterol catabolism regulator
MKDVRDKVIDVAISLADEGGFENVRQRDVAAKAGIALGTLYKNFRSKEEILCAALERDTQLLERRLELNPVKGGSAVERVANFFDLVTRGMCKKPNYARAVLRAVASGDADLAGTVMSFRGRMTGLIIAALRGVGRLGYKEATVTPPSKDEELVAFLLEEVWFASLVGWSAKTNTQTQVVEYTRSAADLLLRGLASRDKDKDKDKGTAAPRRGRAAAG